MLQDDDERRRSPRVPFTAHATMHLVSGDEVSGRVLDISEKGMKVYGSRRVAPAGAMRIELRLGDEEAAPFDVDGAVVREIELDGVVVWGIRFGNLSLGARTRLQDFVRERHLDSVTEAL